MSEGNNARVLRRYVALDIHKHYCVVAGVDREGRVLLQPLRVEHAELEEWLKKKLLPSDHVVIESTANGLWTFNGESKKKVGHPAPFPVELPRRCVKLFSYVDDVVLDPFCGSGTTLIAAISNNRKGLGIDVDEKYCELARKRILQHTTELQPEPKMIKKTKK